MEEVLKQLEGTEIENSQPSQFEILYKNRGRLDNQEERRKEILQIQKGHRNNKLDNFRGIYDLVNIVEQNEIFATSTKAYYHPNIYVAGFNRTSYSNILMLSEWMIEKPEDFDDNWYVAPCPKGVRMLVVASQGRTKFYTKFGVYKFECCTELPGGNPISAKTRNKCCVLDGFYVEKVNTLFIIDILAWNCQPMTDGETEFRQYWLQSHIPEIELLKSINPQNEVIFKLLPMTSCTPEKFNTFMMTHPHFEKNINLDGLLFYHKKTQYVPGETPLVGWLYPFMVQEVLGTDVTVNQKYTNRKPVLYTNQAEYIRKFEIKTQKRNRKIGGNNVAMDTAEGHDEEENEESVEGGPETMESDEPGQAGTPATAGAEPMAESEPMTQPEPMVEQPDMGPPTGSDFSREADMLPSKSTIAPEPRTDSETIAEPDTTTDMAVGVESK